MSGCGTRIVLRGQKPLALCDRCPCFGSLFPPLAALTFAASTTFLNKQYKLFLPAHNTKQPNNIRTQTASYVPEEISVSIKTITVDGKTSPYVFVLLKGTMSIDS